jgi:hypothetical protein
MRATPTGYRAHRPDEDTERTERTELRARAAAGQPDAL